MIIEDGVVKKIQSKDLNNGVLKFPEGVTNISSVVLHDYVDKGSIFNPRIIKKIILPSTVKDIEVANFANIHTLEEVVIPEGVETIGASAFEGTNIKEVKLPSTIKTIGYGAFQYCYNLQSINLPKGLKRIPIRMCNGCISLTSVNIPEGVEEIGNLAFSGCTNLKTVVLPSNLTIIGSSAFERCEKLSQINIPDSVTTIEGFAFSGVAGAKNCRYGRRGSSRKSRRI